MYYKDQLKKLKDGQYFKKIQVFDGNSNKTNFMNLNTKSIPELIKFLEKELKNAQKLEQLESENVNES